MALLASSVAAPAEAVVLVDCAFSAGPGDSLVHGFYSVDHRASTLGVVVEGSPDIPPEAVLASCPFVPGATGGDGIERGFDVDDYQGVTLDLVWMRHYGSGTVEVELTARLGSFDGRRSARQPCRAAFRRDSARTSSSTSGTSVCPPAPASRSGNV